MTKDTAVLRRINQFADAKTDKSEINMFLYADQRAYLYAISSLIHIRGGVFAKEYLELNSVRDNYVASRNIKLEGQNFVDGCIQFGFFASGEQEYLKKKRTDYPRLVITYDPSVLLKNENHPTSGTIQFIRGNTTIQ